LLGIPIPVTKLKPSQIQQNSIFFSHKPWPGQAKTPLRLLIKRQENIISKFPYKNQRTHAEARAKKQRGKEKGVAGRRRK